MTDGNVHESELTPLSLEEVKQVIGKSSQYSSGESIAMAVLDFTAIARAYLRNIPKINGSIINA